MKKIALLFVLIILGCSNESTDTSGSNPISDPTSRPEGVSSAQNEALNVGVGKLGNLSGYDQFYYNIGGSSGTRATAGREIRKVYIKGNVVKFSEIFTDASGSPTDQYVGEYTFGSEITSFIIDYYDVDSGPNYVKIVDVVVVGYDRDYKMYEATLGKFESNLVDATEWETDEADINLYPVLIKIDSVYSATSLDLIEKDTGTTYKFFVKPEGDDNKTVDFSKQVVVADKF